MKNNHECKAGKTCDSAQDFADSLKDNTREVIDWCWREIQEYHKLIAILEKKKKWKPQ